MKSRKSTTKPSKSVPVAIPAVGTRSPGEGIVIVSAGIPEDYRDALDYLASESGMKRNSYIRQIIMDFVTSKAIYPRVKKTAAKLPDSGIKTRRASK